MQVGTVTRQNILIADDDLELCELMSAYLEGEGFVVAEIDLAKADEARAKIPALTHDRPFSSRVHAQAAE